MLKLVKVEGLENPNKGKEYIYLVRNEFDFEGVSEFLVPGPEDSSILVELSEVHKGHAAIDLMNSYSVPRSEIKLLDAYTLVDSKIDGKLVTQIKLFNETDELIKIEKILMGSEE